MLSLVYMILKHLHFLLQDEEVCILLYLKYLHQDSKPTDKQELFQIKNSKPSELGYFLSYLVHLDLFQVLWTYTMLVLYLLVLQHEAYSNHYYLEYWYLPHILLMYKLLLRFLKMKHSEEESILHQEFLNLSSLKLLHVINSIYF